MFLLATIVALIFAPFDHVYRHGPEVLGFLGGRTDAAICAQLTGVDEATWHHTPRECAMLIERKKYSFVAFIQVLVYVALVSLLVSTLWSGCVLAYLRKFVAPQQRKEDNDNGTANSAKHPRRRPRSRSWCGSAASRVEPNRRAVDDTSGAVERRTHGQRDATTGRIGPADVASTCKRVGAQR